MMQTIVELRPDNTRRVWWFRRKWDYDFVIGLMIAMKTCDVQVGVTKARSTGAVSDLNIGYRTLQPSPEIENTGYYQLITESELIDCFDTTPKPEYYL